MKQNDIWLTRFKYSNQIDYKIRPAVVLSNDKFNKCHSFVWACPITTKTSIPEYELAVTTETSATGLKEKSYIRTDTIASIDKELFLKEIGKISAALFEKLKAELAKNL